MCPPDVSRTVMISKPELSGTQQQIVSGLLPYFTYSISVAAIKENGEGRMAVDTQTTLEEGKFCQSMLSFSKQVKKSILKGTGLHSADSNVSDCRYLSDCRSRGREFGSDPIPYCHGN